MTTTDENQIYSLLYDSKNQEIHEGFLVENELTEEYLISKAGGVISKSRDTWSFWVEAVEDTSQEFARVVDPVQKQNFNPPRDFKIARFHNDNKVSPPSSEPEFCPAFEALNSVDGVDKRPHLYEVARDEFMLIDSGAQVCTIPPEPGDQVDPTMALRAVNGARIKCYGTKVIDVKIGRKSLS